MIEVKIPKTLKKFGWNDNKPKSKRHIALKRMQDVAGKESLLFNLSCGLFMSKRAKDIKKYNVFKEDMKWIMNGKLKL